jgi:hypothetical protein
MNIISKSSQRSLIFLIFYIFILAGPILAQSGELNNSDVSTLIPAPIDIVANDFKYDRGEGVEIRWLQPESPVNADIITGYEIYRADGDSPEFKSVGLVGLGNYFLDNSVEKGKSYRYKVAVTFDGGSKISAISNPAIPTMDLVNWNLANLFIIGLFICGAVIYFIARAKGGQKLFIRKIAGLEAVDEAIGRATEMGRPILFIPGIQDMDDVQTIAGITILGRVAKMVADYDIRINMPVSRSLVMTTARETIREAYLGAGRPDAYSDDMVNYITDEQFGYVAAVDGIMVRQKPATCFYLGAFFAESLILAETGNSIGAIQIAGTAMPAQLPFFVAACDYTLIGEELFAASAYLSNEPKQLGSLKGQDVGKTLAMIIIIIGVIAATVATNWGGSFFIGLEEMLQRLFTVVN